MSSKETSSMSEIDSAFSIVKKVHHEVIEMVAVSLTQSRCSHGSRKMAGTRYA